MEKSTSSEEALDCLWNEASMLKMFNS